MVQTEHKQKAREADLTGQTMAEAQRLFQSELGFNKKAAAVLNGIRVSGHRESATVLHGDDTLVFRTVSHRVPTCWERCSWPPPSRAGCSPPVS